MRSMRERMDKKEIYESFGADCMLVGADSACGLDVLVDVER